MESDVPTVRPRLNDSEVATLLAKYQYVDGAEPNAPAPEDKVLLRLQHAYKERFNWDKLAYWLGEKRKQADKDCARLEAECKQVERERKAKADAFFREQAESIGADLLLLARVKNVLDGRKLPDVLDILKAALAQEAHEREKALTLAPEADELEPPPYRRA